MDPRLREFLTRLTQQAAHDGLHTLIWRLSTVWLVLLVVILLAAIVYFRLY